MSLRISRILHAGYLFESGGTEIAFDPIFENPFSHNCHAFPAVSFDVPQIRGLRFAAVFISHYHDDHCSLESLDLLDRSTPIYLYCVFDEMFALIRDLGFTRVYPLVLDSTVNIGEFAIIPRRALDSEVDSMFQIRAGGLNVLNVVDSWMDPADLNRLAALAPWDIVLWPFQTLRETAVIAPSRGFPASDQLPEDWIEQLRALNPRYVVPSSCQFRHEDWSWYNQALFPISYRRFQDQIEAALPGTRVVRLNPSCGITLDRFTAVASPALPWVRPVGLQDVDYVYAGEAARPSTAEIARRFPELTVAEAEIVYQYCRAGLMEKYRSMAPPSEGYFHKPRRWRLSMFDHRGEMTSYHFEISGSSIGRCAEGEPEWTTEVPLAKFFAALSAGETLTSMYVRINDVVFAPAVETEITDADIMEDPLVRCLFTGVFGAYQIAQLQKLRSR